jgi:hypothetical protein
MTSERRVAGARTFSVTRLKQLGRLAVLVLVLVVAGCGTTHHAPEQGNSVDVESGRPVAVPKNRLILPGVSIGGIRFRELRSSVTKALGRGKPTGRWTVSYSSGRLVVVYAFHDAYTGRVQALITRWGGFRTRSGVHVGSTRHALHALHVACSNGECSWATSHMPDAPGIIFTMRHGRVAEIFVGSD